MADKTEVKKFLFDSNRFDEPAEDENDEPEAPVFSEDELEQAKKVAFENGRAQGLKEAEQSREKHVEGLIESIMMDVKNLFNEEQTRESRFEQEAVRLSTQVFKAVFPVLNEQNGLDEIRSMITEILAAQKEQPSILIEVNSEYKTEIEHAVATLQKQFHSTGEIDVTGNDDLGPADCRVSWKDGGAVRDAGALCTQILNTLQEGVADTAIIDDNSNNEMPEIQDAQTVEQDQPTTDAAADNQPEDDNGETT